VEHTQVFKCFNEHFYGLGIVFHVVIIPLLELICKCANAKELDIKQRFLALQNQFNRTQRQQLDRIKARQSEPKSE
jgi:hypothetical protein